MGNGAVLLLRLGELLLRAERLVALYRERSCQHSAFFVLDFLVCFSIALLDVVDDVCPSLLHREPRPQVTHFVESRGCNMSVDSVEGQHHHRVEEGRLNERAKTKGRNISTYRHFDGLLADQTGASPLGWQLFSRWDGLNQSHH